MSLRAHLLFKLRTCSFCFHFKTKKKKFRILKKNSRIFKDIIFFTKLKTFKTHFFKIFIIYKPSLWSCDVTQKIWAQSVQPFWRLLDTNKQTPKQLITTWYICRLIHSFVLIISSMLLKLNHLILVHLPDYK